MSDPWTQLASDASAILAAETALAPIPRIVDEIGGINEAIDRALSGAGAKEGETGKLGLCFALGAMAGRATDPKKTQAQETVLHLELIANWQANAGELGHQLAPLDVFFNAIKALLNWDRGPGQRRLRFANWNKEITEGEVILSADFLADHLLIFN